MRLPFVRFAAALAGLCALIICAEAGPARAAKTDLTIGLPQFPATFHPAIDSMLAKTYILSMTRRPITTFDKDWKLVCVLCVELPTLDNGLARKEKIKDGQTGVAITFTLRPDIFWGDGKPVTAKDILFSWEVGKHPKSGLSNAELYKRLLAIETAGEKTVTLHFDRLTYDYNVLNYFHILPEHLERARFEANPFEYRHKTRYDTDPGNPGLYNGPFRISQVVPGQHVILEPNKFWKGPQPHLKRIVVKVVENTAALEANILSGSIDYIPGELGMTLDQALAFEKRQGAKYNIVYKPSLVYEHIDLNLDHPALKQREVREALLHGLDREALNRELFEGRQPVANGFVPPLDWIYAEDAPRHPYDAQEAGKLLDAAGWKMGDKGLRQNAEGQPLSFELMTTAGNRSRELVQQVLQSQWKRIGVDVRIRNEPARVFFGETVTKRRFGAMAMFAWYSAPESVPRSTLHSAHIPALANNFAGQNYTGFSNPEADMLIDSIETELDRAKRKGLWRKLQHLYAKELPALPLFFRADPYIIPKGLKGIEPTGHQDPSTLWVEQWRWE